MTAETTAKPERAPRPQISNAERDAAIKLANQKAKRLFSEKFEGSFIPLKTVLFNRPVIRAFNRTFHISMRNWYTATSVPRSALGDSALANQVEAGMLKKVTENLNHFKTRISQCEAVAKDASVDFSLMGHGTGFEEVVPVYGPVAMSMHSLFKLCDRYLDVSSALYSYGQISADENNNAIYDVKKRLEAVATSVRNYRRMALQQVNDRGQARDGFKAVVIDGDDAGLATEDVAKAGNVSSIAAGPSIDELIVESPTETDHETSMLKTA